jgi:hypothetical protein
MEFVMNVDRWLAVGGILIGLVIAIWQWRSAKRKGDLLLTFLLGLKASSLPPAAVTQINDMMERLA